jgi:hypothetical protein
METVYKIQCQIEGEKIALLSPMQSLHRPAGNREISFEQEAKENSDAELLEVRLCLS